MRDDIQFMYIAGALFIAALVALSTQDVQDFTAEDRLYCEMVAIHDSSNGEYGWPAYRGRILCNKEKE
jgi:hypothetical protein